MLEDRVVPAAVREWADAVALLVGDLARRDHAWRITGTRGRDRIVIGRVGGAAQAPERPAVDHRRNRPSHAPSGRCPAAKAGRRTAPRSPRPPKSPERSVQSDRDPDFPREENDCPAAAGVDTAG